MLEKLKVLNHILAGIRAILIVILLLICLFFFLLSEPLVKNKFNYARKWRRLYCKLSLKILGCRVYYKSSSTPLPTHYLLVSNHHSFSDPLVTLAFLDGMPVAKAEIRKYPIIGYAALKTGIIYVKREEKNSRKNARESITEALEKGRSVLVYPEGTISPSRQSLHSFRNGVFQSSIQSNSPVICLAIHYHHKNGYWESKRSILKQFFCQFGVWSQTITLKVSDPQHYNKRQKASIEAQSWIQKELIKLEDDS